MPVVRLFLLILLAMSALVPHAALAHDAPRPTAHHAAMAHHAAGHDALATCGDCIGCAMPDRRVVAPLPLPALRPVTPSVIATRPMVSIRTILDPPPPRSFA
jgi:hypothetical protein